MTDGAPEKVFVPEALVKSAEAAWDRYVSTICLGGTIEQRAWAYQQARAAQDKVWDYQRRHAVNPAAAA